MHIVRTRRVVQGGAAGLLHLDAAVIGLPSSLCAFNARADLRPLRIDSVVDVRSLCLGDVWGGNSQKHKRVAQGTYNVSMAAPEGVHLEDLI